VTTLGAKVSTTQDHAGAETGGIAEHIGVPLGTFRAKWAQIQFARYEPDWSQSANAYAGRLLEFSLTMARAEAADADADKKMYGPAFMAAFQATEEFAGCWAGRLPRRKAEEFGNDVSALSRVILEGATKAIASPSSPSETPPRPDVV
jgi:hypothetical protein